MSPRALPLGMALAALLAASAEAAVKPITLGAGDFPGVAVDDAGGAYIAWRGPQDAARKRPLMFCRVPKGATACVGGARALPLPNSIDARPFVFVSGARVLVLASAVENTAGEVVYLTTSGDGGATFGPARSVGQLGSLSDAVAGPGDTISFVTTWASNLRFVNIPADATTIVPRYAQMSVPDSELDFGTVGLDGATPFVLLHDFAGNAAWRRFVSGDLNNDANWTAMSTPGYLGESPHLSSGPLGLFAAGRIKPPSLRPAVLKFAGSGFAAPATIDTTTSGNPIVAQDAGKRLHAIYGSSKLRYAFSDNGTTWKTQVLVDEVVVGAAERRRRARPLRRRRLLERHLPRHRPARAARHEHGHGRSRALQDVADRRRQRDADRPEGLRPAS